MLDRKAYESAEFRRAMLEHEWDAVDRVAMKDDPELVVPDGAKAEIRPGIYTRFSSSGQKEKSSTRQRDDCVRVLWAEYGITDHVWFDDQAQTATDNDRAALAAVYAAVAQRKITHLFVEKVDRISRSIYLGTPILQHLEKHGVALLTAMEGRKLNRADAQRELIRSEEDSILRTSRSKSGLNSLVTDDGGVPYGGACFGYDRTFSRGFPVINLKEAETVKRIFKLLLTHTTKETARQLEREGRLNPSGGLRWRTSTVGQIAKRVQYVGRIHYRTTRTETYINKLGQKNVRVIRRPEYEWIKGKNENLRIVVDGEPLTDDEFLAANDATRARRRNTKKTNGRSHREVGAVPLFGAPICDCAGVVGQRFSISNTDNDIRYRCSAKDIGNGCSKGVAQSIRVQIVDLAVFDLVVPHLSGIFSQDGFTRNFKAELDAIAHKLDCDRAELEEQRKSFIERSSKILQTAITTNIHEDVWKEDAAKLRDAIDDRAARIAAVPRISTELIDFDGEVETMESGFALLRAKVPFVPESKTDLKRVKALGRGIKRVQLFRCGRPAGSVGLEVDVLWQNYFMSEEDAKACGFVPITLRSEFYLPYQYSKNEGSRQQLSQLVASGLHAPTDEQWQLVEAQLPDLTITDHNGTRNTRTRQMVHALMFHLRTDTPFGSPPDFFGPRNEVVNAMNRFISAGGVETLVRVLGAADPGWLQDLDLEKIKNRRRAIDYSKVARVVIKPLETALAHAGDPEKRLSDDGWNAISHLIDPRVEKPNGKPRSSVSMRTAIDGILVKLRTHCSWRTIPNELGGKELQKIAMMLCYHGCWDRIVDVWNRSHPNVLAGLSTEHMDSFDQSLAVRRAARAQSPDSVQLLRKVPAMNEPAE